jgi:hypothetical protein
MKVLAVVAALFLLTAQKPPAACPLLTPTEIAAATSMKVGPSHVSDMVIPSGPAKGQTMTGCMWKLGDSGMLNIAVVKASSKENAATAVAKLHEALATLKTHGWTVDDVTTGGMLCSTAVPPKAQRDHTPSSTGCFAAARGFAFSVGVMAPYAKVPIDRVKTLADQISKRLP